MGATSVEDQAWMIWREDSSFGSFSLFEAASLHLFTMWSTRSPLKTSTDWYTCKKMVLWRACAGFYQQEAVLLGSNFMMMG